MSWRRSAGERTRQPGDGRFYYRKGRYYTKRITLMRWCQAWMAYALAVWLTSGDAGT
jgi:hypothetical protein